MEEKEKKYIFKLPKEVLDGLLKFDEVVFEGQNYFKNYLEVNDSIILEEDMLKLLRKGYPEECFSEYKNPLEEYQEKIKNSIEKIEFALKRYPKNSILLAIESFGKKTILLKLKKDSIFYRYPLGGVKTGLGTGNEEGYLYKYFLNSYIRFKGNDFKVSIYILDKKTIKKLVTKKFKYYIWKTNDIAHSTGSGAGSLTGWINKIEKDDKTSQYGYKKVHSTIALNEKYLASQIGPDKNGLKILEKKV